MPTTPPPAETAFALERFLPYRLSVVTNRISRSFAGRYAEAFGLSIPEWRVLAVAGSFAPLSARAICERTAMDKVKVSRAVGRLVARGLLRRATDPGDRRATRLSLSPAGRRIYRAIVPMALDLERQVTAGLTARERAALDRILDKLACRLDAMVGDATGDPD